MQAISECVIPFRSSSGQLLGNVKLTTTKDTSSVDSAPMVEFPEAEALEFGETAIQLRESERYEYEVLAEGGRDLRLRCSLSARRRSLGESGGPDAGLIETRSFCGTLLMELVEGAANSEKAPIASALIDIRSLKLDYRTEYRGMVRRMSDEIAGLVIDSRASAKFSFASNYQERSEQGWLQLQLELLREIIDSGDFSAAMQRILTYPHERLSTVVDSVSTDRPIRWSSSAVRQLANGSPRRDLPVDHPLRTKAGLTSVADRVQVPRRSSDSDTPENRFVKHALGEFRAFLAHAMEIFESSHGWGASSALAKRLAATMDDWLGRSLFVQIGEMRFAPLGSPVLQRKAGYREILRWWLRFRTAADLSWEGGEDLFRAGQRDVATLYEYWLFFELLSWFCNKCRGGERPPIDDLIDGLADGSPSLKLKKRVELGPFAGFVAGSHRGLNAKFSYNRRFGVTRERRTGGSWTRALHPDYTLTFWPEGLTEKVAEELELLVHIHFDAKYRVEDINGLFGSELVDGEEEAPDGNYKRQDLLKMHAYRDAIKRSHGAYVLYPGRSNAPVQFRGFHEMLPGLGAFGVAPDENGQAQGIDSLEKFLEDAIAYLSSRVTASERLSYHTWSSYRRKESTASTTNLRWPETDGASPTLRATPPEEHHIVIGWNYSASELEWSRINGAVVVALPINSNYGARLSKLTGSAHLLTHVQREKSASELWRVRASGCQIVSKDTLSARGYPSLPDNRVFLLFDANSDHNWKDRSWTLKALLNAARAYEKRTLLEPLKGPKRSESPRITTLDLLIRAL